METLKKVFLVMAVFSAAFIFSISQGQGADAPGKNELVIAENGATGAKILISPSAGNDEKNAGNDLAKYIGMMTGATPVVISNEEDLKTAIAEEIKPVIIIGSLALKENPGLGKRLAEVAKKNPVLRADAIALKREGNRVYLAGSNDISHYFAVAELLKRWGCRWFMQTEFGECIPEQKRLVIGDLDYAYGSPFEVRKFWISWIGDYNGFAEFKIRNMMNNEGVPNGHCLAEYTRDISPGGNPFKVAISDTTTAQHVAANAKVQKLFSSGEHVMMGMEDGMYSSDSPIDKELMSLQYDKYFMLPAVTDAFMVFYNNLADILMKQYPNSKSKIGFLIYSNMTMPPVKPTVAKHALVGYLAPIDIDPIHSMDDVRAAARQEYRDMLYKWAKIMGGQVVIYDYDQGMLVWRDLPNPSIQSFRHDVKHYRKAGILGIDSESRGAYATIFINLYLRARLMWNPDEDVDAILDDFYKAFYGPMEKPMAEYWNAILKAWENTIVTEHEYFVAPAIYTPELVAFLGKKLMEAEIVMKDISAKPDLSRNEKLYLERMKFTRMSYGIIFNYMAMVKATATDVDYKTAVEAGERALALREQLTNMNGILTTTKLEGGVAWFPGEVQQYRELLKFTNGDSGTLLVKMSLEWAFMRDPDNKGLEKKLPDCPVDLSYWNGNRKDYNIETLKDYTTDKWETIRTDLYIQAQGIRSPDNQSYTGYAWYRTDIDVDKAGEKIHIRFPGLFNECWLYVNGNEVGHRTVGSQMWWLNDYKFEWDVDLTGKLKPGKNVFALRIYNPHHFGGMFRRPFLYVAR